MMRSRKSSTIVASFLTSIGGNRKRSHLRRTTTTSCRAILAVLCTVILWTSTPVSSARFTNGAMDPAEALQLARLAAPFFERAGLPRMAPQEIRRVQSKAVCSLWAGMGAVVELTAVGDEATINLIAKRVQWKAASTERLSIGDKRKLDSYIAEANFYGNGHAERLYQAGCKVPRAIFSQNRPDGITILMTKLQGRCADVGEKESKAVLTWLARMHAHYWGPRADVAIGTTSAGGLQPQGCYWYLDTRQDEHAAMPRGGWEGRLRLAARALDLRLKADPCQTICHGDAKSANMLFEGDAPQMYDFQYCGKAPPSKDLAYFLACGSHVQGAPTSELLVAHYHTELCRELAQHGDAPPTEAALRDSLNLAICDLGRWMSGWGWWGHDLQASIEHVLSRLDQGTALASEEAYIQAVFREFPI